MTKVIFDSSGKFLFSAFIWYAFTVNEMKSCDNMLWIISVDNPVPWFKIAGYYGPGPLWEQNGFPLLAARDSEGLSDFEPWFWIEIVIANLILFFKLRLVMDNIHPHWNKEAKKIL